MPRAVFIHPPAQSSIAVDHNGVVFGVSIWTDISSPDRLEQSVASGVVADRRMRTGGEVSL